MKKILLSGSICLTFGMISCGGGSRGLSADIPVFNTVTVSIIDATPSPIQSDVVVRFPQREIINTGPPACNVIGTAEDVCTGASFPADNLTLTFRSTTVRNAQGQPATPIPSPVLVEKYRVSFTGCILGVYDFPVGQVLQPDSDTQVVIQPITEDMKTRLVQQDQYVYITPDGCPTLYNVWTYQGVCNALANLEFSLVELNSGIRRTLKYSVPIRLADYIEPDKCTIRRGV